MKEFDGGNKSDIETAGGEIIGQAAREIKNEIGVLGKALELIDQRLGV